MSLDSSAKLGKTQELPKDFVSFLLAANRNAKGEDEEPRDLASQHTLLELEVEKFLELECYDPTLTPYIEAMDPEDSINDGDDSNESNPFRTTSASQNQQKMSGKRVQHILDELESSRPETSAESRLKDIESETNQLYKERTDIIERSTYEINRLTQDLTIEDTKTYTTEDNQDESLDYEARIRLLKNESALLRGNLSSKGTLDPSLLEKLLADPLRK
eukprot:TRINITY_DN9467_c0_g1_i1.p1 TRINITY_DN9467_c0_g1~~TRINITY_DN9467_c0_g1_i1.p1  ORF type:complete len:218 (-),score=53.59 TRINITY_DN9467_c0_g1_i1:244-897(-)